MVVTSDPAQALAPVNPVRVAVGGHPANSGFLVFVEGDVSLRSDESEGTMAAGGDLVIRSNYNIAAGSPPVDSTFTAPGDSGPTFLYVGGGIDWPVTGAAVNVENSGFTKVADTSTYSAFNRDNNNALVNYRLVPKGSPTTPAPSSTADQRPDACVDRDAGAVEPDRHPGRVRAPTATSRSRWRRARRRSR